MYSLVRSEGSASIPARYGPQKLVLPGLSSALGSLFQQSSRHGVGFAQAVFVGPAQERFKLGEIHKGTRVESKLPVISLPSTPLVGLMHTHHFGWESSGFSPQDYLAFLSFPGVQFDMLAFGDQRFLMALKTNVTPNNLTEERLSARLRDAETYIDEVYHNRPMRAIVALNKEICTEFGLLLYTNQ